MLLSSLLQVWGWPAFLNRTHFEKSDSFNSDSWCDTTQWKGSINPKLTPLIVPNIRPVLLKVWLANPLRASTPFSHFIFVNLYFPRLHLGGCDICEIDIACTAHAETCTDADTSWRHSWLKIRTLPAGTKPGTSHHWPPWGERRRKRLQSMSLLWETRFGQCQSDKYLTSSTPNMGRGEKKTWRPGGYPEHANTVLNRRQLFSNWTVFKPTSGWFLVSVVLLHDRAPMENFTNKLIPKVWLLFKM